MSGQWLLPPTLRTAYTEELARSRAQRRTGNDAAAWKHLERAHIVGQVAVWAHIGAHLRMLGFALRRWDRPEIAGQLLRIVISGPGSYLGRAPLGDTGAARAEFPPAPVPDDLRAVLRAAGVEVPR
jgi:hypothetical protein